jgi:DNA polymerase elongation subunit (family B)
MEQAFRIFDFNVYNEKENSNNSSESEEDQEQVIYKDTTIFLIQIFGINETGKTFSVIVEGFKPFFYVMVNDTWTISIKDKFLENIKMKMGKFYENTISECIIIKRKKLYGFDGGKEHKFIKLEFNSFAAFNKAKNLWYSDYSKDGRKLLENGYYFNNTETRLYEANIPPLLRFFHIKDMSPSGWIALPNKKIINVSNKKTSCDFEYIINQKHIIPLNDKETRVPYKICSFDIEASSSHGDFPIPVKTYKKLATNIIEYFENLKMEMTPELCKNILKRIINAAFGYEQMDEIDLVYPKKIPKTKQDVERMCEKWLSTQVRSFIKTDEFTEINTLEKMFDKFKNNDEDEEETNYYKKHFKQNIDKKATIIDIIMDKKFERDGKLDEINISLDSSFPKLEGDKVTFVGSTFMKYGDEDPYMNHCIALNTCSKIPLDNSVLESYQTEKEVLLAWQNLIQRENPDIIIGYNIFGFDYMFMFKRAEENNCIEDFLKLSRNKDEICATKDRDTGKYKLEESTIQIASGQHDLKFIKINGRLQVDLYNFFRREENLSSYKLDYVAGHFIGDFIKSLDHTTSGETEIKTANMTGLLEGSFVHFEEIGHSIDYYDNGAKFKVTYVNKLNGKFIVEGIVNPDTSKKVRWCLAKDDVTPKDIFRMTNGSADDRAVIAKYCIQDCNLVHYLFNKADILTGFIEMAKICSVPINFLVMRGQGIKLTSYIAKKCREKRTLMPVIEKGGLDDGYEGAIVLDPKCDLYLDNPVACVDYASLYPSCMMSENFSHDSKVWTMEYDLAGNLIEETGEKDNDGKFIYDNLPDYEYVDIEYDTYRYIRKTPASAAEKVKSGTKKCRFAQFPDGKRAIMPSILEELLGARKATRKLIPQQTDEFMKNVLDKRQLGYKVTANSLYGQCGAKTSTFYEMDIAAATTATGRKLLTYAKRIIEECYGDAICTTSSHYGKIKTKAEYIYGDTDSVFFTFNLQTLEGKPIRGKEALEITIELAQEAGHLASGFLKGPHDLEYEKTFMPFCLLSKKRYVGMLYETDPNKCKRKEMGIVLKRRDNAPIVKDIYGGIIDILMKEQNIQKAIDFLKYSLQNLVDEKVSMDKLIITKSLRSGYKNPNSIAHKVLADRITKRDPGNKPSSGDRIPYVYINSLNKKALQGEKIENPTFILENKLKIDYSFYITNQIMKPLQQLFALVLEKIWQLQNKKSKISKFKKEIETLRKTTDPDKFEDKLEQLKNKEVKILLFDDYLRVTNNEKEGNQSLTKFFGKI